MTEALEKEAPLLVPLSPFSTTSGGPFLLSLAGHVGPVTSVAAVVAEVPSQATESPDEGGSSLVVVSASADGSLRSWDVKTSGVLKTFDGHTDKVLSVALSNEGEYAASGGKDKTVRLANPDQLSRTHRGLLEHGTNISWARWGKDLLAQRDSEDF